MIADLAHSSGYTLIEDLCALLVRYIVGHPVLSDAKPCAGLNSIDIGADEQEFPAVFGFFLFNHVLDLGAGVLMGSVFHAVGGDDEQCLLWNILRPGVFVDCCNVVDGAARAIALRTGRSLGFSKNLLDLVSILLALALGFLFRGQILGVGIGTVVTMLLTGRAVALLQKPVLTLAGLT